MLLICIKTRISKNAAKHDDLTDLRGFESMETVVRFPSSQCCGCTAADATAYVCGDTRPVAEVNAVAESTAYAAATAIAQATADCYATGGGSFRVNGRTRASAEAYAYAEAYAGVPQPCKQLHTLHNNFVLALLSRTAWQKQRTCAR